MAFRVRLAEKETFQRLTQDAGRQPDLSRRVGMDGAKYLGSITADLKPEDVQRWANAVFQRRGLDLS